VPAWKTSCYGSVKIRCAMGKQRRGQAVDIYSTADAPRNTRAAYWNSIYSSRFAQVTFNPVDRDGFEAELRVGAIGQLGLARVHSMPADIERNRAHIVGSSRLFSFLLMVRGAGAFSHYGHETPLAAGDFTLCDNATPHRFRCSDTSELIILRATPDILRQFLPYPESLCGLRLPGAALFADASASMAQSLWQQLESGLPEKFTGIVVRNVLDVLATAYAVNFDGGVSDSSIVTARRIQAQRFVEGHLRDQDLTPLRVANALHISPRYLRMLFEGEKESITSYILRRRLEECAKQIASPLWSGHTITEIAFACGFNSAAHFTRAFRQCFGTTPTGYRRQAVATSGPLS
jgi:AraC-like DNA-binding protein